MSRLTDDEFRMALLDVLPVTEEVIWIFSGIWTFAHRLNCSPTQAHIHTLKLILDVLGDDRTLILPSYTFEYARTRVYDISRSKPETGVVPMAALDFQGFVRTRKPINNYLVIGPRAREIDALLCPTAWGEESVMGWAERMDARLCVLGVPWHEACGFFHRAEEVARVPYRYFKRFPGRLFRDGEEIGACEETMYVCSLSSRPQFDWSRLRARVPSFGTVLEARNPKIFIESAKARAIQAAGMSLLQNDPYGLLTNPDQVRYWVKHERHRELGELSPTDQSPLND